ncbi:MAG: hypothetical protein HY721_28805 [Planctomycetes bacterium]|nr:hypothetical protein [Planctomycetota bacterium]
MAAHADDRRDDELVARLPLPLAQLYRRTRNAKSALDRHHNAYYLAEATLKLAACLRIGVALANGLEPRSELAQALEDLCLPSVGHWVGYLRQASLHLQARADAALLPLAGTHERLLRAEPLPAVRAFAERAGRGGPEGAPAVAADLARDAARQGILGFFNLVAAYRNQVFGHGAQRLLAFYEELGPLLLDACLEVLRQECLFGGLTLAVARLSVDAAGRAAGIEWQGLEGLASLTLPESRVGPEAAAASRAVPGEVYFVAPGARAPLHPLVVYREDRSERERVGFLNRTVLRLREEAAGEVRRVEYLDYATGDVLPEIDARAALAALLARLRGQAGGPFARRGTRRAALPRACAGKRRRRRTSIGGSRRARRTRRSSPRPPAAGAGETIGDVVLEGELGRGGMGVVYRARQGSLNRPVALRVLAPGLAADPLALARFHRHRARESAGSRPGGALAVVTTRLLMSREPTRSTPCREALEGLPAGSAPKFSPRAPTQPLEAPGERP